MTVIADGSMYWDLHSASVCTEREGGNGVAHRFCASVTVILAAIARLVLRCFGERCRVFYLPQLLSSAGRAK